MIIEAQHLSKEFTVYRRREGVIGSIKDLFQRDYYVLRAVDDISFNLHRGEILGYIGANGAGKSTTIKMLTGILVPTSGSLKVNGLTPYKDRRKFTKQIGVVFGQRSQLWWDLAVVESFNLLGKIYEVPTGQLKSRIQTFVEILDLGELLHQPVRKLSLGQRMRCELAGALLHNPPLVFLDEPTIGLDVLAKAKIREFLATVNKEQGTTIILTTHDLGDIEALCQKVMIIDAGKIVYNGGLEQLKTTYQEESIEDIVKDIYSRGFKG